jgi:glucokinase
MVDEKRRDMGTNKPGSEETAEAFSLIADIGGTNARFALATADGRITRARTLACADYRDPAHAAQAYLDEEGQPTPAQACFAFACPTHEDRIRMTNNVWDFSRARTKEQLGLQRLEIINDFTALALALPRLPAESLRQVGGTRQEGKLPVGVVGPGTGLGVSGLIPLDGGWVPLVSEGGHASLAVSGPREIAVLEDLERLYGRVSAERVLSGPGIKALYQTLCAIDTVAAQELTPAEITERATAGEDGTCREALEIFCALLGDFAGDFALTLGARGGVYIGGGIVPHLGDFFARSAFRKRFEDKGRLSSYVAAIPCYVISADYPALIGAAACLAPVPKP